VKEDPAARVPALAVAVGSVHGQKPFQIIAVHPAAVVPNRDPLRVQVDLYVDFRRHPRVHVLEAVGNVLPQGLLQAGKILGHRQDVAGGVAPEHKPIHCPSPLISYPKRSTRPLMIRSSSWSPRTAASTRWTMIRRNPASRT